MKQTLKTSFQASSVTEDDQSFENVQKMEKNLTNSGVLLLGTRESKKTLSTNYSFQDGFQNLAFEEGLPSPLDFTFFPRNSRTSLQTQLPLKSNYSNKSVECVIFYGMLFSHLCLQEVKQNLNEITELSVRCYRLIKKSLLSYDDIIAKRMLKDFIFPQSAFRLIENKSLSLNKRKQWLKDLIDKIDSSVSMDLIQMMVRDCKLESTLKKGFRNRTNENQLKVQQLAKCLQIRVKYQSEFKVCSFGKKSNLIYISVKQQPDSQLFHLKRVSYYEDK